MAKKAKVCSVRKNDSKIKIEENGRKAIFLNESRDEYTVTEVDGCLINDGMRADYLITKEDSCSVFVELKGKNVDHAVEQLFASVERLEVKNICHKNLGFLVICKRFPRFDTFVAKAKQKAAARYKAGFHVVCDRGEFDIHQIAAINGRK
ncbi:hypothetical protein [Sphingomonas carotinifaciens]|uniref:Uncharacterized protein n=1 Tax=Sphingomonas carotinifaciens TaxID=1166323 RepID=A0A6N8LY28_9SPHN|nr:hypothetical protein [Sphingomonas carotinifaciens]MBB4085101.1 hypothetical protein [Sphingomonas carotinifaciens]MWC44478.1 hypothetical protein [Sphingomonas carotinifaciens]